MSILINILCRLMFNVFPHDSMSPFDFNNWPCCRVECRGQEPPDKADLVLSPYLGQYTCGALDRGGS